MDVFLEKEFASAGYTTEVFHDQVLFVYDFLTDTELETILKIIEVTPNEDWSIEYRRSLAEF